MVFGNPTALWALALLPLLALVFWRAQRRRRRAYEALGQRTLVEKLFPATVPQWRRRQAWMACAVYALLALSAARPQYGRIEQKIQRAGVDVIVAMDGSQSMMAEDVKPNRLIRAREALGRLVRRFRGNRIGIVAFAGDAFLICPLTFDQSLANKVLQAIDKDTVGVQGTDLGRAIDVARAAFRRGSGAGTPVLVLLTDGEDNEGRGLAAAREAAKEGMMIHAIGIGSQRGAPVPDEGGGFKEDAQGRKVLSRLDMEGLRAIAEATGGRAFDGTDSITTAVNSVAVLIDRMTKTGREAKKVIIYQDRYSWFLTPALALLAWLMISRPQQQRELGAVAIEP